MMKGVPFLTACDLNHLSARPGGGGLEKGYQENRCSEENQSHFKKKPAKGHKRTRTVEGLGVAEKNKKTQIHTIKK